MEAVQRWEIRLEITIREWSQLRIAIDTGGTFTDCVYLADGELRVLKIFSTPSDPSLAILKALEQIAAPNRPHMVFDLRHGTTVGTNAMLEGKGARVAFVTTVGFEDTISIGRQTRSSLYNWSALAPVCLAPRELRFGVPERVTPDGTILRLPTEEELQTLLSQISNSDAGSIAISLLFAFANPETERRVEATLRGLHLPVSTSHRILPEFREYERASTVVVNAYLAPRMQQYLDRLEQQVKSQFAGSRVDVMQSSGGIVPARLAAEEPVRTLLSGPAGGVVGASQVAAWAGFKRIIGFDMGGTSTDVFLSDATSGGVQRTRESVIGGVPVGVPMLDIHTVGAGGGSIARFDAGGMLRVGPDSAGADPGPICFGRGTSPTVTDANLLLGRLDPTSFLGGGLRLDRNRTEQILSEQKGNLATVEQFAEGILRVVETQMEKAIRVISMERGFDPREFTLVAFGGGGPLHACSLANSLRIPTVLIPALPGALSAVGILLADAVRDYSRTVMLNGDRMLSLDPSFAELEQQAVNDFAAANLTGTVERTIDIRYRKQAYELNVAYDPQYPVASLEAFHQQHRQRYGFSDPTRPIEIVNLRLRITAPGEAYSPAYREPTSGDGCTVEFTEQQIVFDGKLYSARRYPRESLPPGYTIPGPALIVEYTSSTIVPPMWRATVDGYGNLIVRIEEEALV